MHAAHRCGACAYAYATAEITVGNRIQTDNNFRQVSTPGLWSKCLTHQHTKFDDAVAKAVSVVMDQDVMFCLELLCHALDQGTWRLAWS